MCAWQEARGRPGFADGIAAIFEEHRLFLLNAAIDAVVTLVGRARADGAAAADEKLVKFEIGGGAPLHAILLGPAGDATSAANHGALARRGGIGHAGILGRQEE